MTTYSVNGQAQAQVITSPFGQAQADIKAQAYVYAQAQTLLLQTVTLIYPGTSRADHGTTSNVLTNPQQIYIASTSDIVVIHVASPPSDGGNIGVLSEPGDGGQTDLNRFVNPSSNTDYTFTNLRAGRTFYVYSWNGGSYRGGLSGSGSVSFLTSGVPKQFAQAQTRVLAVSSGFGQAVGYVAGKKVSSQAQAKINSFDYPGGLAQATALIDSPIKVYFAQAQTLINRYEKAVMAKASSYWRLDEVSGSVIDIIGSVNGTVVGTVTTRTAPLVFGSKASYTFGGGYVNFGDVYDFINRLPFTWEAWITFNIWDNNYRWIFSKDDGSRAGPLIVYTRSNPGAVWLERFVSSTQVIPGFDYNPSFNAPHYIAGGYDGTNVFMFIDGRFYTNVDTRNMPDRTTNFVIGARYDGNQQHIGAMDNVAVYSTALTFDDMMDHYLFGLGISGGVRLAQAQAKVTSRTAVVGQAQAQIIVSSSTYRYTVLAQNPLAYFPLDEPSGSTSFTNLQGTGNAVLNASGSNLTSSPHNIDGTANTAVNYNTGSYTGVYADITGMPTNTGDVVTITGWIKLASGVESILFGWNNGSGDLYLRGTDNQLGFNASFGQAYGIPFGAYLDKWVHIAIVTYNNQSTAIANKIYINGVNQTLSDTPVTPSFTSRFWLSSWGNGTGYWLRGSQDEIAIFARELTATEIAAQYNMSLPTQFAQALATIITTRPTGLAQGSIFRPIGPKFAQAAAFILGYEATKILGELGTQYSHTLFLGYSYITANAVGQAAAYVSGQSWQFAQALATLPSIGALALANASSWVAYPKRFVGQANAAIQPRDKLLNISRDVNPPVITGFGGPAGPQISGFTGNWGVSGVFTADVTGWWAFGLYCDYYAYLYIDNTQVVYAQYNSPLTGTFGYAWMEAGTTHTIHIDYVGDGLPNNLAAWYARPGDGLLSTFAGIGVPSQLLVVGTTETVIAEGSVQLPANRIDSPVNLAWTIYTSQNRNGVHKTATLRLRRTNTSGAILASTSWESGADTTSGHQDGWVSSFTDNIPTDGKYVITFQSTASTTDVATYIDGYNTFNVFGPFYRLTDELPPWLSPSTETRIAQAQADIKQVYQGFGQAGGVTNQSRYVAQAQADIKQTYQGTYAQAKAYIDGGTGLIQWLGGVDSIIRGPGLINNAPNSGLTARTWIATFRVDVTGTWKFRVSIDDAFQMYFNNVQVWSVGITGYPSYTYMDIYLVAGTTYILRMEYQNAGEPNYLVPQYQRPDRTIWQFFTDDGPPWIRHPLMSQSAQANALIKMHLQTANAAAQTIIDLGAGKRQWQQYGVASAYIAGTITNYQALIAAANPTHWWRFNETSGSVAYDVAGGINGTVQAGVSLNANGIDKSAYSFSNGRVTMSNANQIRVSNPNTPYTMEVWINTTASPTNTSLAGQWDGNGGDMIYWANAAYLYGYHSYQSSGSLMVQYNGPALNDGHWHHIVQTYDGATVSLYVDGRLASSAAALTASLPASGTYFEVGNYNQGQGAYFTGKIDEVATYNYALTADQVALHYSTGIPLQYGQAQAMIMAGQNAQAQALIVLMPTVWWKMDDTSGNLVDSVDSMTLNPAGTNALSYSNPGSRLGSGTSIGFDGTNYGAWPSNPLPSSVPLGSAARSIEAWVKTTSTNSRMTVLSYGTTNVTREAFTLVLNHDATNQVGYWTWADDANFNTSDLTNGAWHHIVLTYAASDTHIKVYYDGALLGTGNLGGTLNTVDSHLLYVGDRVDGTERFTGYLDDLRIYNYDLTADQVLQLYNTRIQGFAQAAAQIKMHFALAQAQAFMAGFQWSQAQARIIGFDIPRFGQAQTYIGHFQSAQAQTYIIVRNIGKSALAQTLIQTDYGLVRMTWNNATWVVGTIFKWDDVERGPSEPYYSSDLGLVPSSYPGNDNWGMAWSGVFVAPVSGTWQFQTVSDDGSDLWISGTRVVDNSFGGGHGAVSATGNITLTAGQLYTIHTRFGQGGGPWYIAVYYQRPGDTQWWSLTDNAPPWIRIPLLQYGGQAQAKINSFDYPGGKGQAQAYIGHFQTSQAQGTVLRRFTTFGQAQTYVGHYQVAQANADIKATYTVSGNAQASIFTIIVLAQAQADIKAIGRGFAQAQAWCGHLAWGQAQADIKQTYSGVGQAQTYVGHFQSGQAKADIVQRYVVVGQANAWVIPPTVRGNAQGYIHSYDQPHFAQAQAKLNSFDQPHFGQANALIITYVVGQAQSWIKQTYPLLSVDTNYAQAAYGASAYATRTVLGRPENVIDLDDNTYWFTDSSYNQWIQVRFPSNTVNTWRVVSSLFDPNVNISLNDESILLSSVQLQGVDKYIVGDILPNTGAYNLTIRIVGTNASDLTQIATIEVGLGSVKSPTFAQAQAYLGHVRLAQAMAYVSPGMGFQSGQAQARNTQTYQTFAQANAWTIPPTYRGQAAADILQTSSITSQANAWVIPPTVIANALATIKGINIVARGQATADILTTYNRVANAQGQVNKSGGWANVQATIKPISYRLAAANAMIGHFQWGLAQANLIKNIQRGLAQAWIKTPNINRQGYARASIVRRLGFGNSQTWVLHLGYQVYGNGFALIDDRFAMAQAQTDIKHTYTVSGQANTDIKNIATNFSNPYSQANADIRLQFQYLAQAQAWTSKQYYPTAIATAQIGYFKYAQAQARILAFNVPKTGNAAGYILVNINVVVPGPTSDNQSYLVMYNGYTLPGYAQQESFATTTRIGTFYAAYMDGGQGLYLGMDDIVITLKMRVWEETYTLCKMRVQEAAAKLRSGDKEYRPLYIGFYNKYYLAIPRKISIDKNVDESMRILDYDIEFVAKPLMIDNP